MKKILTAWLLLVSSYAYPFDFREFCGFGQESIGVNLEVKVEYPTGWVKKYPSLKDVKKRVYLSCNKDRGCAGFITEGNYHSTHVGHNHQRYHESLSNLTPADVYFGRGESILEETRAIKEQTIQSRRLQHQIETV